MTAPNRARLTQDEVAAAQKKLRAARILWKDITEEHVAGFGSDKAWDMCRAEAIEAAEGLVVAARTLRNEAVRGDLCDQASAALAAWDKWVNGGG